MEPCMIRKTAAMQRSSCMISSALKTEGGFANALVQRSGHLGPTRCYEIVCSSRNGRENVAWRMRYGLS